MIHNFAQYIYVLLGNFVERKGQESICFNVLLLQYAVLCNIIYCDSQNTKSGLSSNNLSFTNK